MLATLLLSLYAAAAKATQFPLTHHPEVSGPVTLHLRHVHAATEFGGIVFADAPSSAVASENDLDDALAPYTLATQMQRTHRPSSLTAHALARARRSEDRLVENLRWKEEEVVGPNVTSRETLLRLAKMTSNAYVQPKDCEWYGLGGKWNVSFPFGWEDGADGFRGHIFSTSDNSTVAITIKGTSAGFFGGSGSTGTKDKLNNNLLFSCCCAYVGFTWTPVCGCSAGGWKCDQNCVEASLVEESLFYPIGTNLYNNVSYMYPNANIWIIGHSLGGSLASLLGVTFGSPTVAFEAPGEKMAAQRLHLPSPPSTQHVTHVYHSADPLAMGTCNGILSTCAIAGYAMESRCHMGRSSVYDTVTQFGWSVNIGTHGIKVVIELLSSEWDGPGSLNGTREVPEAKPEEDCIECYRWEYGKFLAPGDW